MYKGPSDKFIFFNKAVCKTHAPFIPIISSQKATEKISV
jgi:hypothetical protein